ncbi:MAG: CoB--CoM heterodisulfide reductase iron-sulfur subunit A family protein [Chloroflexota bacterium]
MGKKIGVYVCECGPNIADNVDIDRVLEAVSSIEDVEVAERYRLLCSEDGKEFLKESIKEHGLTHVVVAACSPKQHELTFMNVCEEAGVNPYLFQLANIREQCAWVTPDKDEATEKALRYTRAAISRVRYHIPLEKKETECSPDVLVVGGGIAGIRAGQSVAVAGRKAYLVEKSSSLGGKVKEFEKLFPHMSSASDVVAQETRKLLAKENIEVLTESEVKEILGFLGNFQVKVKREAEDEERELNVGAVVLATGFELSNPEELPRYGYRKFDDVYTSLEFERMNASGEVVLKNGKPPSSVAIIHCVGRKEKGYCSRVCCLYSLKFARYLKSRIPDVKITHFYSDLCIPGKSSQRFYEETKDMGVDFVRAASIEVAGNGKGMAINYETEAGSSDSLAVDMVILAPAMEPSSDAGTFAEILNIPLSEGGFFAEEHEKLAPISAPTEGVFIVGCAQGPKNVADSVVQAEAAAGKILSALVPGRRLELEAKVSHISELFCTGCQTCISVCPYGAITLDEMRKVSVVNEVLCHGCGNCVAACPSGAASVRHFAFTQVYQELEEVLR